MSSMSHNDNKKHSLRYGTQFLFNNNNLYYYDGIPNAATAHNNGQTSMMILELSKDIFQHATVRHKFQNRKITKDYRLPVHEDFTV